MFLGTANNLINWRGWRNVYLTFNANKKLVTVDLEPSTPITEQQADTAIRDFGMTLDRGKYVAAEIVHAYRNMTGPVRTINYQWDNGRVTPSS